MFGLKKKEEKVLTLPQTEQEKLDLLTPKGYENKIVEAGDHTVYMVYNKTYFYCYTNLKHVQDTFM